MNKIAKNEREKNLSGLILFYTSDVEYACLATLIIHEQTFDYFIYVPKDLHIHICPILKGVPVRKIETHLPFKFTLCQTYLQMEILVSFFNNNNVFKNNNNVFFTYLSIYHLRVIREIRSVFFF